MHILMIEDNHTLATLFGVQLRQLGHTLVTAATKEAAISAFQSTSGRH